MKTLHATCLIGLLLGLAACSSPPKNDFAEMVTDIQAVQTELATGVQQIQAAAGTLQRLADATGDLRQPVADVAGAMKVLQDFEATIKQLGDKLRQDRTDFQNTWQESMKDVSDPDVKHSAEMGRDEVLANIDKLSARGDELRKDFEGWRTQVDGFLTRLQANMSAETLAALKTDIEGAQKAASQLATDLQSLSYALTDLADSFKSSTPAS